MRIALLTDGIWPYVMGGMQKHSYFLCKYLAKKEIHVLLVHPADDSSDNLRDLSCFTEGEKAFIEVVFVRRPCFIPFPGHYLAESYRFSKNIFEVLGGYPAVDFIIAKGMTGWYFLRKKSPSSPPVGVNIHGYEFMQKKANVRTVLESVLLGWPLRWINRRADYIFSYGGRISSLIRKLGVSDERIIEIPAAIEAEWLVTSIKPSTGIRKFVFVGRYERRKGIEELHVVIGELVGKFAFEFNFVGPIPEEGRISHPCVRYFGPIIEKDRLQSILQDCEVLVCPSYAEGMPNVILEGMANGCSVIATDVGAVSLMVNSENGWLIPPGNTKALRTAFLEALTLDGGMLDTKRELSKKLVENRYLWSQVSNMLVSRIERIVER